MKIEIISSPDWWGYLKTILSLFTGSFLTIAYYEHKQRKKEKIINKEFGQEIARIGKEARKKYAVLEEFFSKFCLIDKTYPAPDNIRKEYLESIMKQYGAILEEGKKETYIELMPALNSHNSISNNVHDLFLETRSQYFPRRDMRGLIDKLKECLARRIILCDLHTDPNHRNSKKTIDAMLKELDAQVENGTL